MTIDLDKMDAAIRRANRKSVEYATNRVKKIALAIDQAVVLSTPVDEGTARANWLPSLDTPILEAKTDITDKSGTQTMQAASDMVDKFKLGQKIYISNNLPYIGALNDGHSKQQPAGFVERAISIAKGMK